MHRSSRRARVTAAAAAAGLCLSLTATSNVGTAASAATGGTQRVATPHKAPPGPAGAAITVDDQVTFSGYDMATDPTTNTAYLAWISANSVTATLRDVHLCVLPPGANGCAGGVLTADAIGDSSAADIQVEVTSPGIATLVWFYQHDLTTGKLAAATYAGGALTPSVAIADAPSNGLLFDVVPGPDGNLWAVTRSDSGAGQNVQVRQGLAGAPTNLVAPWMVGNASLAFAGSKPVLMVAQYGQIAGALHYASGVPWTGFAPIAKTWTLGIANDLVGTSHGVRMLGSEDNAGYRPSVARWTGAGFSKPQLIGDDNSCAASTHDVVSDGSGRVADVVSTCENLTIYNLPDTKHAAIVRFKAGGTFAGGPPQITTTTRGHGWVAWGILSAPTGNKLLVRPVRLPALMKKKSAQEKGNKVTVTGPVSCLPVVTVKGRLKTDPAQGWNVVSKSLKLDGDDVDNPVKIDGEKLAAGSEHVLLGKGVFKKGNDTVTVTKKFKFKAC